EHDSFASQIPFPQYFPRKASDGPSSGVAMSPAPHAHSSAANTQSIELRRTWSTDMNDLRACLHEHRPCQGQTVRRACGSRMRLSTPFGHASPIWRGDSHLHVTGLLGRVASD